MPRARRFIESLKAYEIVIRVKAGIPLPCTEYMSKIVRGCLARTQRDHKVTICGYVVMGSHLHIIAVCHSDQEAFTKFHMELKKKLTESIKAILGLSHLLLWDGTTTVMQLLDQEKTIQRIAYCYSNPANANLAETIEDYPGLSSWDEFQACSDDIGTSHQSKEKWIRYASMKPIGNLKVQQYLKLLDTFDSVEHALVLEPNAWMPIFGITESKEVKDTNQQIVLLVRENEQLARDQRREKKKTVWNKHQLRAQSPTVSGHIPKKRERKIFFLGSTKEIRLAFYAQYVQFVDTCRELYDLWKKGDFSIQWPPQAFIPWRAPFVATG